MSSWRQVRRRTTVLAVGTALVAGALAGCGSDEPSEASGTKDSPSPSASSSSSTAGPSDEELAKVVSGDVEDLTWAIPKPPASWKVVVQGKGEIQWRVTDRCLLTLQQPAGLSKESPGQEKVVTDGIAFLQRKFKTPLKVGPVRSRQFPVRSNLANTSGSTKVSVGGFTGAKGVQGEVYAHRAGTFALVAITICGSGTFAQVDPSQLQPFIDRLAVQARY